MRLLRFMKFDLRHGIARFWYRYVVILLLFLVSAASLEMLGFVATQEVMAFSFGDRVVTVFAGMEEYVFAPGNPFDFPAIWMLALLTISYLTLNYPYDDLLGTGKTLIVESEKRSKWWYSKCVWVVVNVSICFLIAGFACFALAVAKGGGLGLQISQELPEILGFGRAVLDRPGDILAPLLLMPLTMVALCLFQLVLSLVMRPIPSYIVTISVLLLSAYFKSPWLPGNYLMFARSGEFIHSGMQLIPGIGLSLAIAVLSVVLGHLYFKNMDIIERV